jgi:hypothetical protein
MSESEFMKILMNDYTRHVASVHGIKSYTLQTPDVEVTLHVSSEHKPSHVTVRLVKACAASLGRMFGPPKYSKMVLLLIQNGDDKIATSPLTKRKVNTGFSLGNTVVVYRCQEMHKVLVHEMLHFWGTHDNATDASAQALVHRLGAPRDCVLYESYVETLATIMMCGFCARSGSPRERLQKEVVQAYRSAKTVVSMEQHDTNVWAYYVARACLFACMPELSGWLGSPKAGGVRRLKGSVAWNTYARIVEQGMARLGGPTLAALPPPKKHTLVLRSCDCNLGPSFSKT